MGGKGEGEAQGQSQPFSRHHMAHGYTHPTALSNPPILTGTANGGSAVL